MCLGMIYTFYTDMKCTKIIKHMYLTQVEPYTILVEMEFHMDLNTHIYFYISSEYVVRVMPWISGYATSKLCLFGSIVR